MSFDDDDSPPHDDADAPSYDQDNNDDTLPLLDFDDLFGGEEPKKLDSPTKEKIIDVYNDASKALKPAIEKVKEKVRSSGVHPDDLHKAEHEFAGKGDNTDEEVRRIVSDVGDLVEAEDEGYGSTKKKI